MQHAHLLQFLLKAVLWVGWSRQDLCGEAGNIVAELLEKVEELMSRALKFTGVVLTAVHSVLSHIPLPTLPAEVTTRILAAVISLGSPTNLVKAVRDAAGSQSPISHTSDWNTAPHPTTPQAVALLVTEISNILLARSLTPPPEVQQMMFVDDSTLLSHNPDVEVSPVWKNQTDCLLAEPAVDSPLDDTLRSQAVLDQAAKLALLWWNELTDSESAGSGFSTTSDRRTPILRVTGNQTDDEVYLTVAVLHLLNLLSLLSPDEEGSQLARLKQLLSETSTISDARVLQAAFVCLAIFVRK